MSANVCSITGQPLMHPVVSKKTGNLYEKQVIQKHLANFPYCPVTNQDMSLEDIIQVTPSSVPISSSNESARVFMAHLQQQYDTLILESHQLRQALKKTKQQLVHSSFQNEAAERVIAKLLQDKQKIQKQVLQTKKKLKK